MINGAVYKKIQKNEEIYRRKEKEFTEDLDNLFDIAHLDALNMIKIEESTISNKSETAGG